MISDANTGQIILLAVWLNGQTEPKASGGKHLELMGAQS